MAKKKTDHSLCEVTIIDRPLKGNPNLRPGLFCVPHGRWIKWLKQEHAEELKSLGVPRLGSHERQV